MGITKKLSEQKTPMTENDLKIGRGVSKTVSKFLCHLQGYPVRQAFMRIYYQIPVTGTECDEILAEQVVPPPVCAELESFKILKGCSAAPRCLDHAENTQEDYDLVPGDYIQSIVWGEVPGEPLMEEFFWDQDRDTRDGIREQFQAVYKEVLPNP